MNKSKRKTPNIITVIVLLLAAGYFLIPEVRFRLYPFNRIKGNITVIKDGEICHLEEDNIRFPREGDREYNENKKEGRVKIKKDTAEVAFRGGKYGAYCFYIDGFTDGNPVLVRCFQANWWDVQRFDITLNIDTASGNIVSEVDADDVASGDKNHHSFTQNYKNEDIRIGFGL